MKTIINELKFRIAVAQYKFKLRRRFKIILHPFEKTEVWEDLRNPGEFIEVKTVSGYIYEYIAREELALEDDACIDSECDCKEEQ